MSRNEWCHDKRSVCRSIFVQRVLALCASRFVPECYWKVAWCDLFKICMRSNLHPCGAWNEISFKCGRSRKTGIALLSMFQTKSCCNASRCSMPGTSRGWWHCNGSDDGPNVRPDHLRAAFIVALVRTPMCMVVVSCASSHVLPASCQTCIASSPCWSSLWTSWWRVLVRHSWPTCSQPLQSAHVDHFNMLLAVEVELRDMLARASVDIYLCE